MRWWFPLFLCSVNICSIFLLENLLWCLSKVWKLTDSINVTFWTFKDPKMSFEDTSKNVHFYLASFTFWRIVLKKYLSKVPTFSRENIWSLNVGIHMNGTVSYLEINTTNSDENVSIFKKLYLLWSPLTDLDSLKEYHVLCSREAINKISAPCTKNCGSYRPPNLLSEIRHRNIFQASIILCQLELHIHSTRYLPPNFKVLKLQSLYCDAVQNLSEVS